MNILLETYKEFHTKIDVDFIEPTKNLNKKGEFFYYRIERLFITKLITLIDRKEFKDLYDISHIIPKLDLRVFKGNSSVAKLIEDAIKTIENEDIVLLYKKAFRNVDLRFKSLKEPEIDNFVKKLIRELRVLRNKI
ncbi:nucleotidyl transferase AbiEii/AbiGii toxin family protein [Candidatus Woesearchaeota archaeon]|nr:nucleotidyl transferase AbiEii/AbiGii toxin family protein [Candidatus Woesearchaeota archaeon]